MITIAAGESYVYTFVNYNKGAEGANVYENWVVEGRRSDNNHCFDFRADGGFWTWKPDADEAVLTASYTGSNSANVSTTAKDWLTAYNGVTVTLTITRSADGNTMTVEHSATTNNSTTYAGTFTCTGFGTGAATFLITNELSHQNISKVVYTDASAKVTTYASETLSHTAGSSRNGSNAITTTVDQEKEHYNNAKAAAWGGWAYAEFSLNAPEGSSISEAVLVWSTTIGGNKGTRNNDIYYVNAGTTIDYNELTSSTNLNLDGTFIVNKTLSGPATHYNVETDVTSAVRTINASQSYIIFKWTNNAAGADLFGKASVFAPTLHVTYTTETFYTATFTETAGLTPTVTIYTNEERTNEIENGGLSANTTYYFTATLAGYEDYSGSFSVETSDPTVNFTMSAKNRYTFTVNLINSANNNVIKAIYTDEDSYDGKGHVVEFPKYLTDNENRVTYSKDDDTYYRNYTSDSENATITVSYTAYEGEAYFVEGEALATLKNTIVRNGNMSGNAGGRGLNNSSTDVITIPVAGTYNIIYAVCSNNVNASRNYSFYKNNSENTLEAQSCSWSVNGIKTTGTKTINNIVFTEGDKLIFHGADTQIILDYVYIVKTGEASETVVVSAAGYATYVSENNLDFSEATTKAYKVKVNTKGVATLTEVEKVPANTPVLLYAENGNGDGEAIPVVATADAVEGNDLVAGAGANVATTDGDYTNMILNNVNGNVGFYFANNQMVATNRAYLHILTTLAPDASNARMQIVFDSETSGIKSVNNALNESGNYFNLSGQRISEPAKGLYIVNGKKVIIK